MKSKLALVVFSAVSGGNIDLDKFASLVAEETRT